MAVLADIVDFESTDLGGISDIIKPCESFLYKGF